MTDCKGLKRKVSYSCGGRSFALGFNLFTNNVITVKIRNANFASVKGAGEQLDF